MPFDSAQISAFAAVVREGSLGRAAIALGLTQPALSRMIQRLERRLGAPLFERHSKGMMLTDVGRTFLPHAMLLQTESQRALEEVQALRGAARGVARVGAIASVACSILPRAIERVHLLAPGLRFEVVEGVWDVLSAALARREIDIAFAPDAPDTDEIVGLRSCRWTDATFIVAAQDHPLRQSEALTLEDVARAAWALPPKGTGPHQSFEQLFAAQGLGLPEIVVETRSITVLKGLVMTSGFLSLMAGPMFEAERRAHLIAALPAPHAPLDRTLVAFRRRRGSLPVPAAKLLAEMSAVVAL